MLIALGALIIVLGLLILFHELGHFFSAKIFKVKVEEFGFGYPPRLIGWVKNDENKWQWVGAKEKAENFKKTVWSLNWIPIGGFVKIKGENESQIKEKDSFGARKIWQRAVILVSGVVMNFILCVLLLAIGFNFGMPAALDEKVLNEAKNVQEVKLQVVSVNKESPAATAGLIAGDEVISINDEPIEDVNFLQSYVASREDEVLVLKVLRGEQIKVLEIQPEVLETSGGRAVLGVGVLKTGRVTYVWYKSVWYGIVASFNLLIAIILAFGGLLKSIFATGEIAVDVSGPVGIAVLAGQMANLGIVYLMQFTAILSINLLIINILPFPALDGGRLLFLLIEKIRGREINAKIEALVHNLGFVVLMLLIVLVTYRDLTRWGGQILERIF